MANIKSAKKRIRQNKVRRARNKSTIRAIRTAEKKFLKALPSGSSSKEATTNTSELTVNKANPQELLRIYTSKIDKASQKGIVKSKKASRKISRLSKQLQAHL